MQAVTPKKGFGTEFTDHMLKIEYVEAKNGWQSPRIVKFENISLHPAAKVLHYAIAVSIREFDLSFLVK